MSVDMISALGGGVGSGPELSPLEGNARCPPWAINQSSQALTMKYHPKAAWSAHEWS